MKRTIMAASAILMALSALADATSVTPAVPYASWVRRGWFERFDQKKALAAKGGYPVLFVGDSITHFWESKGAEVWKRHFAEGDYKALNIGISGDRTENILWRLQHGQIDGLDPKAVVVMIGTNNIGHRQPDQESGYDTFCGVRAIVDDLEKRCPNAQIIVHTIFPRAAATNDQMRIRVDAVNLMIRDWIWYKGVEARKKKSPAPRVLCCDFAGKLVGPDGTLSREMAPDLLHPGPAGYELWANELRPYLDYAFGKASKPPAWLGSYSCPTAIPVTGPHAVTAKGYPYWLANAANPRILQKVNEIADNHSHYYDMVLLGDSITHFWEGSHLAHYKKTFDGYSTLNLAFGGMHTEHVLWNITYGGFLDKFQTRLFTLLIGTNNRSDSAEDTALGIRRILEALAVKQPNAKVILMPIFPRYERPRDGRPAGYLPGSPERVRNEKVNELIRPLADGQRVIWCDFNAQLAPAPDGVPSQEIFRDGVHPTDKGYDIWAAAMMPVVEKLIGPRRPSADAR